MRTPRSKFARAANVWKPAECAWWFTQIALTQTLLSSSEELPYVPSILNAVPTNRPLKLIDSQSTPLARSLPPLAATTLAIERPLLFGLVTINTLPWVSSKTVPNSERSSAGFHLRLNSRSPNVHDRGFPALGCCLGRHLR